MSALELQQITSVVARYKHRLGHFEMDMKRTECALLDYVRQHKDMSYGRHDAVKK